MLLGGRTAEELVFHEPTTGAANDIEKATSIARRMVTEYGMSEQLGARKFGNGNGEVVPGPRDGPRARLLRGDRRRRSTRRSRRLIEAAPRRGLGDPRRVPRRARRAGAGAAWRRRRSPRSRSLEIFAPVRQAAAAPSYTGYGKRLPSDRPPVLTPKELALIGAKRRARPAGRRRRPSGTAGERRQRARPTPAPGAPILSRP